MKKGLFTLLVAGTLAIPTVTPARSYESIVRGSFDQHTSATLPLPPVPYMPTVQWLTSGLGSQANVEPHLGSKFDTFGPLLFAPTQFSSKVNSLDDLNSGSGSNPVDEPQ